MSLFMILPERPIPGELWATEPLMTSDPMRAERIAVQEWRRTHIPHNVKVVRP